MKIKILVMLLLAGVVLAYAGVKGYVHYKVKKQVDALVLAAAPFADVQYGSIGSSLNGVVRISDIAVSPRDINDTVTVKQLRIETPGLGFLLQGGKSMQRGELPERFGMELQGAAIKLDGGLVRMLEKLEAEQTGKQPAAEQVCALSRDFITAQYRQLGFTEMLFDTGMTIERRPASSEIRIGLEYRLHGIEQGDFTMTFEGVGDSVHGLAMGTPLLKNAKAGYKPDAELIGKSLKYCAGLRNIDTAAFIDDLFAGDDEYFAETFGFIPGPGMLAGMQQMIRNRDELRIDAMPLSPLDLGTVHLYKPEDWPGLFGLTVTVGDTPITDLSFKIPENASFFELPGIVQKDASGRPVTKPAQEDKTQTVRASYEADVKDIPGLVGKEVRIFTKDGKQRDGWVLGVEHELITLEKQLWGGSMSTRVPVASVKKIEVLE